jgi:poly(3-hydroxybutyrate) depolymerase
MLAPRFLPAMFLVATAAVPARADGWPYPSGISSHAIEGLQTELVVPRTLSAESPASLVVVLHGLGGTATGMAGTLASWAEQGYVVCAPKSKGQGWTDPDVAAVLRIAAHLETALPIDPKRVHVVGFSNGGWNLHPLAFDEALKPCSATWVAAGFAGGSVPKWAKTNLGAIALAGSQDGNLDAARATVPALEGKVRSVEVRVQPGLGHEWPDALMPYLKWWMGVQEGRFVPGEDLNFDWSEDLKAALAALEGKKRGGVLLYAFDSSDAANPDAKALQNEVFLDPGVRRFGSQLKAVKWERSAHADELTALGVATTPSVAVLDEKGVVKKVLSGKIKASALEKALRSVAPDRSDPR